MEISNKTLTWLVILAISISIVGTMASINTLNVTGMLGEGSNVTGQANITLGSQTTLRYSTSTLFFGILSVNTTTQYCNITFNGTSGAVLDTTPFNFAGCDNQTGQPTSARPLTLENAGSTNMNITLNFSHNGGTLFPGSIGGSPVLMFNVNNNESGSCTVGLLGAATWTNVTAAMVNAETLVCGNLSYADGTDSLIIGLRLGIPLNAPSGDRSLSIKAQGISISP